MDRTSALTLFFLKDFSGQDGRETTVLSALQTVNEQIGQSIKNGNQAEFDQAIDALNSFFSVYKQVKEQVNQRPDPSHNPNFFDLDQTAEQAYSVIRFLDYILLKARDKIKINEVNMDRIIKPETQGNFDQIKNDVIYFRDLKEFIQSEQVEQMPVYQERLKFLNVDLLNELLFAHTAYFTEHELKNIASTVQAFAEMSEGIDNPEQAALFTYMASMLSRIYDQDALKQRTSTHTVHDPNFLRSFQETVQQSLQILDDNYTQNSSLQSTLSKETQRQVTNWVVPLSTLNKQLDIAILNREIDLYKQNHPDVPLPKRIQYEDLRQLTNGEIEKHDEILDIIGQPQPEIDYEGSLKRIGEMLPYLDHSIVGANLTRHLDYFENPNPNFYPERSIHSTSITENPGLLDNLQRQTDEMSHTIDQIKSRTTDAEQLELLERFTQLILDPITNNLDRASQSLPIRNVKNKLSDIASRGKGRDSLSSPVRDENAR